LFGDLKVQSFILTKVSDCGLLIVVTSSTFLQRKDMFFELAAIQRGITLRGQQHNCPSTRNDRSAQNNRNQQQLITPSRQRATYTTAAHLHWCGDNPLSSWPAQAASHGGDPMK